MAVGCRDDPLARGRGRGGDLRRHPGMQERREARAKHVQVVDPHAVHERADGPAVADIDPDVRPITPDHEISDPGVRPAGSAVGPEPAVERPRRSEIPAVDNAAVAGPSVGIAHQAGAIEGVRTAGSVAPRIAQLGPCDADDLLGLRRGRRGGGRRRRGEAEEDGCREGCRDERSCARVSRNQRSSFLPGHRAGARWRSGNVPASTHGRRSTGVGWGGPVWGPDPEDRQDGTLPGTARRAVRGGHCSSFQIPSDLGGRQRAPV